MLPFVGQLKGTHLCMFHKQVQMYLVESFMFYRKTKKDADLDKKTGIVTHVSQRPTHSPSWEEMVTLNLNEKSEDESKCIRVSEIKSEYWV